MRARKAAPATIAGMDGIRSKPGEVNVSRETLKKGFSADFGEGAYKRLANSSADIGINLFKANRETESGSSSCPEVKNQSTTHPQQASTPRGAPLLRLIALGILVAAAVVVLPRGRQS